MDKMFLSVKEAQEVFGISIGKMYDLTRQKDFPVVRVNKRVLIPIVQLEAWIADQAEGPKPEGE